MDYIEKRKKISKLWILAIALLLFITLIIIDRNRTTYEYYAFIGSRYSVPCGICPLTEEQVSSRNYCYRFEYSRPDLFEFPLFEWRIKRICCVNSSGLVIDWPFRVFDPDIAVPAVLDISYTKGRLSRITYANSQKRILKIETFGELDADNSCMSCHTLTLSESKNLVFDGYSFDPDSVSQIHPPYRAIYYDYLGRVERETYHTSNTLDTLQNTIVNKQNVYGKHFSYNEQGQLVRLILTDSSGKPRLGNGWFAEVRYEYKQDNLSKISFFDEQGNPSLNRLHKTSALTFQYDVSGNLSDVVFQDVNGQYVSNNKGYAKNHLLYDRQGNITSLSFYDISGHPVNNSHGFAEVRYKYDQQGAIIKKTFYDANGKPFQTIHGFVSASYKNNKGRPVSAVLYESSDSPDYNNVRPDKIGYGYNKDERVSDLYYYKDGLPYSSLDGKNGAHIHTEYDEYGRVKRVTRYDKDGKLYDGTDGCHTVCKYDTQGNLIYVANLDGNDQLHTNAYGYACAKFTFDDFGRQTGVSYFDKNNKPESVSHGCSHVIIRYDSLKNIVKEVTCLDEDNKPVLSKFNYAVLKFIYEGDSIREMHFYDAQGLPMAPPSYTQIVRQTFDKYGRPYQSEYFDAERTPITNVLDIFRWTAQLDLMGNIVSCHYSDTSGKPARVQPFGFAAFTAKYDAMGHRIEQHFFDEAGQPCANNRGIAYWKSAYWSDDRISLENFDLNGRKIADVNL